MAQFVSILFVEDSKADQLAFQRFVEQALLPYKYDIAGTIQQAEQFLQNNSYDLIISDHKLPDGSTFDLFPICGEVPVIITTGTGDEEVAVSAMKAGAYDYLIKDFERQYLKFLPVAVEQALRQQHADKQIIMLSQALMSSNDCVFIADINDEIITANKAFYETYQFSEKEILGQPIKILWQDNTYPHFSDDTQWEVNNSEFYHQKKCGETFPVWLTRTFVTNRQGENIAIIHVARDVTTHKATQEALTDYATQQVALNEKLAESERELRALNKTKDKFLSILSHDLRNAFGAIRGYVELLADDYDEMNESEIRFMIGRMDGASNQLAKLLENMLYWARLQSDKVDFYPQFMRVDMLINEAARLFSVQAMSKNIELKIHMMTEMPAFADPNMIDSVIRNLISNAIKFTPSGGKVTVSLFDLKNQLQVEVSDTGVGIPPNMLSHIFEMDTSTSTKGTAMEQGTGLGLTLCKELVERNHGRIWVESVLNKGSRFFFSLPKVEKPVMMPA